MLTRVGHLLAHGHRPKVVFLGAHLAQHCPRFAIAARNLSGLSRRRFADDFETVLADPARGRRCAVIEEIDAQRTRVEHDRQLERLRSDSDRLDEMLTDWVCDRLTLMESSRTCGPTCFACDRSRAAAVGRSARRVKYSYDLVRARSGFQLRSACGPWCGCCGATAPR